MLLAKVAKVGKELCREAIWFSVGGSIGLYCHRALLERRGRYWYQNLHLYRAVLGGAERSHRLAL